MTFPDLPRFGFVTCVQLGLSCIEAIYEAGGRLDSIVTLRDELARRKAGRVYVDEFARKHGVPVTKIRHINDPEAIAAVRSARLDWLFIIGWSQIASMDVLAAPRLGVLGIHPSLLPVGRGRAAIPWAILKGLPETGVTLFKLDAGVDTGPVLSQQKIAIESRETATTLYAKVVEAHRQVIANVWPSLVGGSVRLFPQDESKATVWTGRTPADGEIALGMSVEEADRLVRATTKPYPGAFIDMPSRRLRIWAARAYSSPSKVPGELERLPTVELADGILVLEKWDEEPLTAAP